MKLHLYATLRIAAGGRDAIEVGEPATVREALERAFQEVPALREEVMDENGELKPGMSLFLHGRDIRYLQGLDTPIPPEADLRLFPPVAGGQGVRERLAFRVARWIVEEALVDFGGRKEGNRFAGPGWSARVEVQPVAVGAFQMQEVQVHLQAESPKLLNQLVEHLRWKTLRGGG